MSEQLWALVKRIPAGRVASYGALGRCLETPLSGYFVGRLMARCPADVPWWRVVTKNGDLAVHKRDPLIAAEQRQKLRLEKTTMADDDRVSPSAFVDPTALLEE